MINLVVATLYPGGEMTPEMRYTYQVLKREIDHELTIRFAHVQGGQFSHRHPKDKLDPIQCQLRDKYLEYAYDHKADFLLILDSDEVPVGAYGALKETLQFMLTYDYDYAMITEIKSDFERLGRPRLLRMRPGLTYQSQWMKHDKIGYTNHNDCLDDSECKRGLYMDMKTDLMDWRKCIQINYIDVEAEDRSCWLRHLGFAHNKRGFGFEFYNAAHLDFKELPKNFFSLDDIREIKLTQ